MTVKTKPQCAAVAVFAGYNRLHMWRRDDVIVIARFTSGLGTKFL